MIEDNKSNKEHLNWYNNLFLISAEVENHFSMSYIVWCVISVETLITWVRVLNQCNAVNNAASSLSTFIWCYMWAFHAKASRMKASTLMVSHTHLFLFHPSPHSPTSRLKARLKLFFVICIWWLSLAKGCHSDCCQSGGEERRRKTRGRKVAGGAAFKDTDGQRRAM